MSDMPQANQYWVCEFREVESATSQIFLVEAFVKWIGKKAVTLSYSKEGNNTVRTFYIEKVKFIEYVKDAK